MIDSKHRPQIITYIYKQIGNYKTCDLIIQVYNH